MASLNDAYARVREQTESNNAEREGGYGVFQGAFQNILSTVNEDLDPENITKPLSPIGAALDSVLGFREKQIKDAAKNSARLSQAEYDAGESLRAEQNADKLSTDLDNRAAVSKASSIEGTENLLPNMIIGEGGSTHVKDFIRRNVVIKPSLYKSIENAHKANDMFQVFKPGHEARVKDGTLLFTDPNGNTLYATGNTKLINMNRAHYRLTARFNTALEEEGFITQEDKALLRDTSIEGREKLFGDSRFQKALNRSIEYLTPEMLEGHELYERYLGEKFNEINKVLEEKTSYHNSYGKTLQTRFEDLNRQIVVAKSDPRGKDLQTQLEAMRKKTINEILANTKITTRLQLNSSFQGAAQTIIFRRAYAQALIKGMPSTETQAKQHINNAIEFTKNDKSLGKYAAALNAYYGDTPIPKPLATPVTVGDPDTPPKKPIGSGQTPPSATNKAIPLTKKTGN